MKKDKTKKKEQHKKHYTNKICTKKMSFEECELAILRTNVDKIQKQKGYSLLYDKDITKIIDIIEGFLKERKLICYGGTAINEILPEQYKFYDKSYEFPDYDFFSTTPLKDAKTLADIYFANGYTDVEAKAGIHFGTYKVFVNFIPIADITYLHPNIFKSLIKDSVVINKINYASPNFLRMSMYLELSRPNGDTTRWEKILKRLTLLNKAYPLKGDDCNFEDIQRRFLDVSSEKNIKYEREIYGIIYENCINIGVVFFGAYANSKYLKTYKKDFQIKHIPDFDVLSETPLTTTKLLKDALIYNGYKNVKIIKHDNIGELIAPHYELKVGNETIIFVYEPIACHSYNIIEENNKKIKIASIDTMLSFYLAFIYANRKYYDKNRILCMSEILFKVQQKNRLSQKGILKRFSINCYGKQITLEDIRKEKAEKYKQLKNKKNFKKTRKYEEWFLKYIPAEVDIIKNKKQNKVKKSNKSVKAKANKQNKTNKTRKFSILRLF